jgi:hypothetical protein
MNTIFKKNQFQGNSEENSLDFGTSPLSKIGGMMIRDLPQNERKNKLELYRPPGIVKKVKYVNTLDMESQFGDNIWNAVPSSKIFVRDVNKRPEGEEIKNTRSALYTDPNEKKKKLSVYEKALMIPYSQRPALEPLDGKPIDYLALFDTDFPPEYNEIVNASKEDKEGIEKERIIREMIRKNERKYKEVKNLLPKESIIRDMMKVQK